MSDKFRGQGPLEVIIVALIILAVALLVASCKKCVTCTETITTQLTWTQSGNPAGAPTTGTATYDICGTSNDIKNAEGTVTATVVEGTKTATTTIKTDCR
jgi:hypothetical protein